QHEYLEIILVTFAAVVDSFECREDTVENILNVRVEGWSSGRCVFWFTDSGGFEVVFEISIVSRFKLVLPPNVVGVASGPANFVISEGLL
ncbi:MAG: hypothetical protein KDD45_12060, partial [Bdellovibrionales bacterium]|nr:hypothetical protein [Bdellovibrionales bacterium]